MNTQSVPQVASCLPRAAMHGHASTSAPACSILPASSPVSRSLGRSRAQPPRRQHLQRCRAVAAATGKLLSRSEVCLDQRGEPPLTAAYAFLANLATTTGGGRTCSAAGRWQPRLASCCPDLRCGLSSGEPAVAALCLAGPCLQAWSTQAEATATGFDANGRLQHPAALYAHAMFARQRAAGSNSPTPCVMYVAGASACSGQVCKQGI